MGRSVKPLKINGIRTGDPIGKRTGDAIGKSVPTTSRGSGAAAKAADVGAHI
jgi:hypothetical protein